MGIYTNHGVEYYVRTDDGKYTVIVPVARSDARLEASRYYAARKASWFGPDACTFRCTPIDDCDISLTSQEEEKLQQVLLELGERVVHHGWYDVVTIGTTY